MSQPRTLFTIGEYEFVAEMPDAPDESIDDLPLQVWESFKMAGPVLHAQIDAEQAATFAAVLLAWIAGNPSQATVDVMREFCGFVVRWRRGEVDPLQAAEVLRAIGMVRQIHRDGEGGAHG